MKTAAREREGIEDMVEGFVVGLDCLDAVMLLALLKAAPDLLALALARTVVAVAEAEGLTCRQPGHSVR